MKLRNLTEFMSEVGPGDQRFVGSLVFLSPSADRRAIILSPPDRGTGVGSISFSCLKAKKKNYFA